MEIDELLERYRNLRLTYFPHWKVSPWEKREKESTVNAFLNDLEAMLLGKHWTLESRSEDTRIYRNGNDPRISLRIRNYVDYFGVHTVYLIDIYLMKKRNVLWDKVVADGELVFDHLKKMA